MHHIAEFIKNYRRNVEEVCKMYAVHFFTLINIPYSVCEIIFQTENKEY